jgi:hypothetical protein
MADDVLESELIEKLKAPTSGNIREAAYNIRLFKALQSKWKKLTVNQSKISNLLEHRMFPWLKLQVQDIPSRASSPRGIVMCAGDQYFPMAVHAIRSLRLINCSLPIEIFHLGHRDLSVKNVKYLQQFPDVNVIDIEKIVDNKILDLKGWDIKPFAMLMSSFKEVLLMDADVIFVAKPEMLFQAAPYVETGALFFTDRITAPSPIQHRAWLERIIPEPHSESLRTSVMYTGRSNYQQEAGVVLIDKTRHLFGLLAVCRLNTKPERTEIQAYTHGEKESYWIGFELIQESYRFFSSKGAGIIGYKLIIPGDPEHVLFGHLAHFDHRGKLIWFNDGVIQNKHKLNTNFTEFTYMTNNGRWDVFNLKPEKFEHIPTDLSDLLKRIKAMWTQNPLEDHIMVQNLEAKLQI